MAKRKSPVRSRRKPSQPLASKSRSRPKRQSRASRTVLKPTRASRALARKRSAASVKGWETRRLNIKRAFRSLAYQKRQTAARKGWETRRKREGARRAGKTMKRAERARAKQHPDFVEHQASVRYTRKHGASTGHSGTLQGSIFAPKGTPASELRQALIDHIKGKTPKFETSAVEWRRRSS